MGQLDVARFCHAQFTELGLTREERLEFSSTMLHRTLLSSKELTQDDWQKIADGLRGYRLLRVLSSVRQPLLPSLP